LRLDSREIAAIFAGGMLGALLRATLSEAWGADPGSWPWVTFGVNVLGALLLGYFITRMQERLQVTEYGRPFVGTGICGALTTFSAMQLELFDMIDLGHYLLAAGYATASLAAGLLAVALSTGLVRRARLSR
jgi:CrcB protein